MNKLDAPPKAIYSPSPCFVSGMPSGKVLVEFYIDKTGKTRFPRVVSSDDAALEYSGVEAVARRRFEPPMKDKRAVDAPIRRPVLFERPLPKSEAETPGTATTSTAPSQNGDSMLTAVGAI